MMHRNVDHWALIVFTRWPVAGRTKTRLIPAYGADGAADIHRQLIARTANAVRALPPEVRTVAAIAEAPDNVDTATLFGSDWPCVTQRGADLGERMANAFDDAFAMHPDCTSAVLIGVDCPDYSAALFEQAAASLQSNQSNQRNGVVYAPTEDGGYGLVGVRRDAWNVATRHAMFAEIPWGSSSVMQTSLARLQQLQPDPSAPLQVGMLQLLWDIDTPVDVKRAIAAGVIRLLG
jgi:uncharacterized protein